MIDKKNFLIWQPTFPEEVSTDGYYLGVARHILKLWDEHDYIKDLSPQLKEKNAIYLTCYFQDVIADAGIWRGFVDECRRLYGYSVPFHEDNEEYIDYELNRADVRFLLWYGIAMMDENKRLLYPHDEALIKLADVLYEYLESIYEDSPEPEGHDFARGLEFTDPEDREKLYNLANWLFMHCYLLQPAFSLDLQQIVSESFSDGKEDFEKLRSNLETAMVENPTGPLALYVSEWLSLLVEGKIPHVKEDKPQELHSYYKLFIEATGGKRIQYFKDYESLNRFFIEKLHWEEGEEHLPMMKGNKNFVLFVDPYKGMLAARNIAGMIADPENELYDKEYASEHAIYMLTERGLCPADLLKYIYEQNWVPDATFPGTENTKIVTDNHDFISRCYLQQFYRGD